MTLSPCRVRSPERSNSFSGGPSAMLDPRFVVEHLEEVKANCANRNVKVEVDRFLALEALRKDLIQKTQQFQQRQNEVAKLTGKEKDPGIREGLIREGKALKEQVTGLEKQLKEVEAERDI